MQKISVAIATYNEEKNIVDCIKAAHKLTRSVVIVDGNSIDKTKQLSQDLGAKVITTSNKKMFHINKNIAIRNCKTEWILVLDADEVITDELAQEIKELISKNPTKNGFWINRKNWFLGDFLRKGGAYPDPVIRLFRKGKGIHPEISVHEQIKIDGDVGTLKNDLLHFADPDFNRYLMRMNRYTDLTASDLAKRHIKKGIIQTVQYMLINPAFTFANIYVRNKGYQDGFRGFVWALFSASHHYFAYSKYWSQK